MRLGKDLINKPIYSIDEGKLLGKVQDLYLDSTYEVILGLYTGSQGIVRRKAELVPAGNIVIYGTDAILVGSSNAVTDDGALPAAKGWLRRDKLSGREVDSPAGTRLGIVGDVIVDAVGRVTGFALSKTFVEGPLAAKRVIDRGTVIDTGQEDGAMTVDLVKLEAFLVNAESAPEPIEEGIAELPNIVVDDE